MVVPWRFRSEGCNFSEEDWESLRMTIIRSLRCNSIGLGGPLAHGAEWDYWFEDLVDTGGIGEKYWGESRGRELVFPRDRTAIQTILRAQVVEMAGVERGKLKVVRTVETPNSDKAEEPDPPTGVTTGKEPHTAEQSDDTTDINHAVADPQRRGPGRPRKKPPTPGARPKKHVAIEENNLGSVKRSRVSKGEEIENVRTDTGTVPNDTRTSEQSNYNHPVFVRTLRSPAATPTPTAGNSGLIFETRLFNSQKSKFIYASDTPSLSLFFKKVREKFQLRKEQKIDSIEVEIGTRVFVVDLNEERDWLSVIGAAEKSGDTGVGVIVGVV